MTRTISFSEDKIEIKVKVYSDGRPATIVEQVAKGTLREGKEFNVYRDILSSSYFIEIQDDTTYGVDLREIVGAIIELRRAK